MPPEIKKKNTLLLPSGYGGGMNHLYIILTNPCNNNKHLLVSLSSIKEGRFYDSTCIIRAEEGAHPFIIKDSFVYYQKIEERFSTAITKCIDGGTFIKKEDMPSGTFARICDGISQSDHTPAWAEDQYNNWPD